MLKGLSKKHFVLISTVSILLSGCTTILETGAFLGFFALHGIGQVIEPILNPSYPTVYPTETALTTAVLENNEQQVADLISHGVKLDQHIRHPYLKSVNDSGASMQTPGKDYFYSALDIAVVKDNIAIAKRLLEAGADTYSYVTVKLPTNIDYDTLLIHQAVINNSPAITGLLLDYHTPVNILQDPMIYRVLEFRYDQCLSAFDSETDKQHCLNNNLEVASLILQKPLSDKLCKSMVNNRVAAWDDEMIGLIKTECSDDQVRLQAVPNAH